MDHEAHTTIRVLITVFGVLFFFCIIFVAGTEGGRRDERLARDCIEQKMEWRDTNPDTIRVDMGCVHRLPEG